MLVFVIPFTTINIYIYVKNEMLCVNVCGVYTLIETRIHTMKPDNFHERNLIKMIQ